jgi:hypothetical protein
MSDFSDLKSQIIDYANRGDWSDVLVTSLIRAAEAKLNAELRIDRMIQNFEALLVNRCAPLPDDWLEMELVRLQNPDAADGFSPVRYEARDEFFRRRMIDDQYGYGRYTLEGRQIYFGGTPDVVNGITYKIVYYGEVPQISDAQTSWVYTKFPTLYLHGALMQAALHAVGEEQSAGNFKQLVEDQIQKLNAQHRYSRASGSRVNRKRRGFG